MTKMPSTLEKCYGSPCHCSPVYEAREHFLGKLSDDCRLESSSIITQSVHVANKSEIWAVYTISNGRIEAKIWSITRLRILDRSHVFSGCKTRKGKHTVRIGPQCPAHSILRLMWEPRSPFNKTGGAHIMWWSNALITFFIMSSTYGVTKFNWNKIEGMLPVWMRISLNDLDNHMVKFYEQHWITTLCGYYLSAGFTFNI